MEAVLQESLHELYEHAPCGYVVTLPDGDLLHVNQTFLDWTGYSAEELLGRRIQELLSLPGRMFYENQYFPLLRMQGSVQEVALDIERRDGSRLPTLVNSVLRLDEAGRPVLVASAIFSAAERRAYERELLRERRRAEQLAEVVTVSHDAILQCSADGAVQAWNRSAERLFGYDAARLPAMTLRDLIAVEGDDVVRALREGTPVHTETLALAASGKRIDVAASITPHTDDLGRVDALSVILHDIGERRELERLQQEFIAMASHELRSPMASIGGFAQLMKRRAAYSEQAVDMIIAQTQKLARLIDDLLAATQIEAARLALYPVDLDLVALVRQVVDAFPADGHSVSLDAPNEPVVVHGDRQRLDQVFMNLLTNAAKYSPEETDIAVTVRAREREACIEIVDHGVGIAPEHLPHIFDRFYRVSDSAQSVEGTGLGLFITRSIVELHHGTIRVESEPGQGTRFTVTLPLAVAARN